MPDVRPLDDDLLAVLVDEVNAKTRRLIVVAATQPAASAWATWRGVRKWYWCNDASMLFDLNDDTEAIMLVKGYRQHTKWRRIKPRLEVVGAHVPIYSDALPAEVAPPTPTIGGAYLSNGSISRIPVQPDQGDRFIIGTRAGNLLIDRNQVEELITLLAGWESGEPIPDPTAVRRAEILAAIQETGDPYGRREEPA